MAKCVEFEVVAGLVVVQVFSRIFFGLINGNLIFLLPSSSLTIILLLLHLLSIKPRC